MTVEDRGRALPAPQLAWEQGRIPYAARFGDIYYSRDGGLRESRHVFLEGNGLPDAWRGKAFFVIAELGFGTGLNFLATWDLWRRAQPARGRLHYIAAEAFPLSVQELGECLAPWDEVRHLARGLIAAYPEPQRGFHRVHLENDVTLTLLYGDATQMLGELEARVDAWFLDGFAPDKNPEMWSAALFTQMARLSQPGARAATYSVAGAVRRGLEGAGFDVARAPGFGAKREMLRARFRGGPPRPAPLAPWFAAAPARPGGHAAIIGAGLAGAHCAAALARRGWSATIVERHARVAAEGSGIPRAVMAPRLTAAPAHDGRFYAAAWRHALHAYGEAHGAVGGALQLDVADHSARLDDIAASAVLPAPFLRRVDAKEASEIAGVPLALGGLFFPQGGWVDPRRICAGFSAHAEMRLGFEAARLAEAGGRWRVCDAADRTIAEADVVVLANALGASQFSQAAYLPLEARRGQITLAPESASSGALRTVLSYGGYITPAHDGVHLLGATFDTEQAADLRPLDHTRNFEALARIAPELLPSRVIAGGFAAVRCMSPDHLPIIGPLPDRLAYLEDFADLRHGQPWRRYPQARYHPGLYVLAALGARGAVAAPLGAELLACLVTGEPWPLERALVTALHPARFLVRDLKRRYA